MVLIVFLVTVHVHNETNFQYGSQAAESEFLLQLTYEESTAKNCRTGNFQNLRFGSLQRKRNIRQKIRRGSCGQLISKIRFLVEGLIINTGVLANVLKPFK